jgi:hypothetical protein
MRTKLLNILKSIKLNGRDISVTLIMIVIVLFVANVVAALSAKMGLDLDLTRDFIFAVGKFAAIMLCGVGYLTHITFRGSLGKFDAEQFDQAWSALPQSDKFGWFMKAVFVGIGAAALVFSIGV